MTGSLLMNIFKCKVAINNEPKTLTSSNETRFTQLGLFIQWKWSKKNSSSLNTWHRTMFMIENLIDLLLQELGLAEAVLVWLKVVPDIPGSQQHELAGADWAELHVGQGRQIKSGAELLQLLQPLQLGLPLYLPGSGLAGVETIDHLEDVELRVLLLNAVGDLQPRVLQIPPRARNRNISISIT